ncbi:MULTISPECIES: PDDEXK nuclease domain-containing protein [Chryseobacterium]|uniref:Nuclease of restriction endonuclease-like (RecB) superfamily n=1 Tax=Chryseobacterium geocarposphaerae TaxID=1416776 RepID=A0ABU1LI15_9FLAO|nr:MULTISPECIES: PDDEXK nuclease domain-containing protein [Chryseobacterium]MDR6406361.1 putative nuclease of restriction endonuclease-like (RecB) superfamily [Chryseobacterium geocarposphaerae]MDR6699200.1 putative nuclease of restriction endonuclease-like (RecB) superfamily [Chryseobacterium ginsenosidimutans]
MNNLQSQQLLQNISALLDNARKKVVVAVNQTMVLTYYEIGRMIVEDEQNGENRAEYGKTVLKDLSLHLTKRFGKGFSVSNLKQIRQFYLIYSKGQTLSVFLHDADNEYVEKRQTLSGESETTLEKLINQGQIHQNSIKFKLSWSHYLKLMRIKDAKERRFYEIESYKNNWSLRELQRQYDSALYTRLSLSKNKEEILQLSEKGQIVEKPKDLIKDPYILEFLGLSEKPDYSENELESELIDKLEHFLLELGTGFTFVARQDRITFDEKHFKIDLVFYNRILKCFVLIDLKIGELKHQDIGQMQMYVNYFDREKRFEGENKTIGIILCQDKSEALVQYTLPEDNSQIFASKYLTVLPTKEDFINILNSDNGKIS